jgi:hypothetical protein
MSAILHMAFGLVCATCPTFAGVYTWTSVKYIDGKLQFTPSWADAQECVRFVPYIDNRNGAVYAKLIRKNVWTRVNATTVTTTDVSCQADQDEVAGCYPHSDREVHAVAVTTYRCRAGPCLHFSPAFLEAQEDE